MHVDLLNTAIGAVLGAGSIIGFAWRWSRGFVARAENFFSDWEGEKARPGVPARPGVMERLADGDGRDLALAAALTQLTARVERIEGHLSLD